MSNSRSIFNGRALLNLPLRVWTKTTLPPDALQHGPVGTPHRHWPFHTASGQNASASSPWSNTHHHPPVPPPSLQLLSPPTPRSWWYLLAEANAPQYSHSEWSPLALGDCSGLIRSFMMKWAERPQLHPAPASNHSSLNWWGSSPGPTGFKSWITFLFRSLSNYLHPS